MKTVWVFAAVLTILLFTLLISNSIYSFPANGNISYLERLSRLEPGKPELHYDYEILADRDLADFKAETLPIATILKKGKVLHFVDIYFDPIWQRPAYHPDWHSSNFRWSDVPYNLAIQQHKLFTYQAGASWWYDLSHHLALPEQAGVVSPLHKDAFTIKYPYVTRLIVFDAKVIALKYYQNQLAVVVQPDRSGIHVLDFEQKGIRKAQLLLQMVTPDGYELDYALLKMS